MNAKLLSLTALSLGLALLVMTMVGTSKLNASPQDQETQERQEQGEEQQDVQEEETLEERVRREQQEVRERIEQEMDRAERMRERILERGIVIPRAIEMRGGGPGGFSSMSVSEANGVRTVNVNENGKKFVIKESSEGIEVSFVKTYGPDDMEELKTDHPDLHMHVVSFPSTTQDGTVSLTINVEVNRDAPDAETLKAEHPEAFKIYEKYSQAGNGIQIRGGLELAPERLIPRIERILPAPDGEFQFDELREEKPEEDEEAPARGRRIIKT